MSVGKEWDFAEMAKREQAQPALTTTQIEGLRFCMIGVLLNSALYLVGAFAAGLLTHNGYAWKFALVASACTYLCYLFQATALSRIMSVPRWLSEVAVGLSIIFGAVAGLALLIL